MLKLTTKSTREIWQNQVMTETTRLKLVMTLMTQLLEPLFKLLFLVHTQSSNMTQLMMNANNFMPDKGKLQLLLLKELNSELLRKKNAEQD